MFKYSLAFFDNFIEKLTLTKFFIELGGNILFTLYYVYLFVTNINAPYLRYAYGIMLALSAIYVIIHLSTSFFSKKEIKNIKKVKDIIGYIKIGLRLLVVAYNIYLMSQGGSSDIAKALVIISIISIALIVALDIAITALIKNFFILRSAFALDYNAGDTKFHFITNTMGVSPFLNNLFRQYGEDKYAELAINLRIKKDFKDLINYHSSNDGKLLHNNKELLAKYYVASISYYQKRATKKLKNEEDERTLINLINSHIDIVHHEESKQYIQIFSYLLLAKYHQQITGLEEYDRSFFLGLYLYIKANKSFMNDKEDGYEDIIFLIKMYGLYLKQTYYAKKDDDPFKLTSKEFKDDATYNEIKNISTKLLKIRDDDINLVLNTLEKILNETEKKELISVREELYELIIVIRKDKETLKKNELENLTNLLQDLIDASRAKFLMDKYRIPKAYNALVAYVTELGIS